MSRSMVSLPILFRQWNMWLGDEARADRSEREFGQYLTHINSSEILNSETDHTCHESIQMCQTLSVLYSRVSRFVKNFTHLYRFVAPPAGQVLSGRFASFCRAACSLSYPLSNPNHAVRGVVPSLPLCHIRSKRFCEQKLFLLTVNQTGNRVLRAKNGTTS